MRPTNSIGLLWIVFIGSACIPLAPPASMAQAQQVRVNSPLDDIRYDAARSGPLLLVDGRNTNGRIRFSEGEFTLEQWGEAHGRRVVVLGSITALPPNTMEVIEQHPGIPDPYATLKPGERVKLLLSLFSEAQWKLAGSSTGIGLGDLDENQRPLFIGLLPGKIGLQTNKLVPGNMPGTLNYQPQGGEVNEDPSTAHLRLNRKVAFGYSKLGSTDMSAMGGVEPMAGDVSTTIVTGEPARGDAQAEPGTIKAFGVPIIKTVPSQLKPGQLNYAQTALRVQILLDPNAKTVAELLSRVAQASGLELTVDRRLADMPLVWRIAPAQKARAGDILQALCWSVTGAFRRVGASTYLLTDDVQGIGTRFARLGAWAEKPYLEREKAMNALNDKTAKNNPLSHVGFASGDPYSLPAGLQQRVDSAILNGAEDPWVSPSNLPAPLQQQIEKQLDWWKENALFLRSDRVQISTEMTAQFVFPDGAAAETEFSQDVGHQYLQNAAKPPKFPPNAVATALPAPKPMPVSLHKRILVAKLPQEDKAVSDLLTLAKSKGFSELWLHVMLDDGEAVTRLYSALKTARKVGISVGCAVSLLHKGGLRTPEDINILGETGDDYSKRQFAADADYKYEYEQYAGWSTLDPAAVERILVPLASVQGLSALALKDTAAPGYAADTPGGDGIMTCFGYTENMRLLCIRSEGFDPIDVSDSMYALDVEPTLPLFPTGGVDVGIRKNLKDFRFRENSQRLGQVHAAIKKVAPSLPLYLDDRGIIYTQGHLNWYGRWDIASRMPINHIFNVESEERADAYLSSDEPIRIRYGGSAKPEALAVGFGRTAQDAAKNWRGVALDISGLAPADALKVLAALPVSP